MTKDNKPPSNKGVSTEDAKKSHLWAVIPIDKLGDNSPVIAIQEFASKNLAKFHLVEEVIVPVKKIEKRKKL